MLIDAHAHLQPKHEKLDEVVSSGIFEQIWLMDLSGAEITYTPFASEDEVLEVSRRYEGFFIPFGYLDLEKSAETVDRQKEKGFVGLKPYKPLKPYNDPSYFPIYERAQALGMPIMFHTGLVAYGKPGQQGEQLSHGPGNMRPSMLDSIAEAFPRLTIIGGHLGYPWLEETAAHLYYYPNIYHDLSGYRKDVEWLIKNLDRKCHDGTKRYFNDKILFATDVFYGGAEGHKDAFKLATFWELFLEMIGGYYYRWGEPEEREKVLRGNARKIFDSWQGA